MKKIFHMQTEVVDISSAKRIVILLAACYLAFSFYLFLSHASINVLLFYAIFTYVLYVPFVGIFSQPEKLEEFLLNMGRKEYKYLLHITIFLIISGILLIFTKALHPNSLMLIAHEFIADTPRFFIKDLVTGFVETLPWYGFLFLAFIMIIAWQLFAVIFIILLLVWLAVFLFHFVVNLLIFLVFLGAVLFFFYKVWDLGTKGYKNNIQYIDGHIRKAIYMISTFTMAIYIFILLFANLIIRH